MNALFTFAMSMGNVFVNVFVYSYTQSLELTLLYACIRYFFIPIFSLIGGRMSTKHDLTRILSIGLVFMTGAFLYLLWIQDGIAEAVWKAFIVAGLTGCGEGLFWYAMNVMNQKTPRIEARSLFLSNMGLLNGIANIFAPVVTAVILGNVETDMFGYSMIFTLVIVLFIVVAYMSLRLSYVYRTPSFPFLELFKKGSEKWEYQKKTAVLHSLRECYTMALSGLLVFRMLNNSGEILSYYNALISSIVIASYWVVGRKVRHAMIINALYIGSFGLLASMLILSFSQGALMALLFGIINAISTPLYLNGFQMIRMRVFTEEAKDGNITGHIIASEFLMNIGRILGLGTIVILARSFPDPAYIQLGTIFMALGGIGVVILTYRMSKKYELV